MGAKPSALCCNISDDAVVDGGGASAAEEDDRRRREREAGQRQLRDMVARGMLEEQGEDGAGRVDWDAVIRKADELHRREVAELRATKKSGGGAGAGEAVAGGGGGGMWRRFRWRTRHLLRRRRDSLGSFSVNMATYRRDGEVVVLGDRRRREEFVAAELRAREEVEEETERSRRDRNSRRARRENEDGSFPTAPLPRPPTPPPQKLHWRDIESNEVPPPHSPGGSSTASGSRTCSVSTIEDDSSGGSGSSLGATSEGNNPSSWTLTDLTLAPCSQDSAGGGGGGGGGTMASSCRSRGTQHSSSREGTMPTIPEVLSEFDSASVVTRTSTSVITRTSASVITSNNK